MPLGCAVLGWLLVHACLWLFYPHYGKGLYFGDLDLHLSRTVSTNTQNVIVAVLWLGTMLVVALQRDRASFVAGAIIGGGLRIGFTLRAPWCLGYVYAPNYIDWWKMWELNAVFNMGVLHALAMHWAVRHVDKVHAPDGCPLVLPALRTRFGKWSATVSLDAAGSLLIFAVVAEHFPAARIVAPHAAGNTARNVGRVSRPVSLAALVDCCVFHHGYLSNSACRSTLFKVFG